ncbi:MAG: sigma 54-interacting transcriptional regulator, partial [Candidatus Aminicenantes bacterium]|nr:sigma 54-interacting transcriptional regulator [Candidatus Aminicenantes bacterium]
LFPKSYEVLMQGKHLNLSRLEDIPEEAPRDRQSFAAMGIKSTLTIPLSYGGRISSVILIQHMRRHQTWPEEYIPRLRLLGDIFVGALGRKEDRSKLEGRLRFETLLSEISGLFVNLPVDKIGSGIEDAQRRICELFDLGRSTLWQICGGEPGSRLLLTYGYFPSGRPELPERMYANDFFPWVSQKVLDGETVILSKLTDLPPEAGRDLESFRAFNTRSTVVVPLSVGEGPVFGMLAFGVTRDERGWSETALMGIKLVAQVFANALARKQMEEQLRAHLHEIEGFKQRLEQENIYLHEEIKQLIEYKDIIGQSAAIKKVLSQAEQVARTDSTVLLLGETGTGKELLARAIHGLSARKNRPLVTVNCASLPPTLIESELFGREKGAYTGALTRMAGRFELADGSTLFLDEIGELPLELQSKLLRFLEEGSFERLGSTKSQHVDVRIIAATNRDIEQDVADGKFRRDLFYRLNVFPIVIPPLRERLEDIPLLVWAVVKEFQKKMGKDVESIPKKAMQDLQSYSWPGNVRELRNLIEHAMILSRGKTLDISVPKRASAEAYAAGNLNDMERVHMTAVLEKTRWRISGPGGAAEVLGLKRTTLLSKMKKLGIKRSGKALSK